jgi:2-methylcitrate dehydratase PrpD
VDSEVERLELRVHSLVLELTGKKEPKDGLQGKFSVYHGCAVGLIHGQAGEGEFSDAVVNDPRVVALRGKVRVNVDDSIDEEAAHVAAVLKDGRRVEVHVKHAVGSRQNPLTDVQLEAKFASLVEPVLGRAKADAITASCWKLAALTDVRDLTARCRP